jgi:hypothetical protein
VRRLAAAMLGAWGLFGCRDIDRFDTEEGVAYCGGMVNFGQNGFVSRQPDLKMQLELDMSSLTVQPGTITTSDRANGGVCNPLPLFEQAALRAIPEIMSDQLSLLEFGDGREYNFFAWADSNCFGTVVAVVSLMKNDDVEVRLLKPKPPPPAGAPEADQPGFILFHLLRQKRPCNGFVN